MYFNENNTRFHNKNNEIAQQKAEIDQSFDFKANDMLSTVENDAKNVLCRKAGRHSHG